MAAPLGRCCCRVLVQNKRSYFYRALCSSHVVLQPAQPQTSRSGSHKIVIPKRKQRNATSILEALSSTLEKDYDAPHYKYIDDPYLIPASATEKRTYSLSRASGEHAAEYVLKNFPKELANNPAEPSIEAFLPPSPHQHSEDSLAGLEERINSRQPLLAFQSRQALKEAGTEVPEETLNHLLELLCYYNSEDPTAELLPDEQFYEHDPPDNLTHLRKSWKSKGPAEQLYSELKEQTPAAQLALLKGRAKYFDVDGAMDMLTEMRASKDGACVDAYNAILRLVPFMREKSEPRWELIQELLSEMASRQLKPTLATFNSVLYALTRCARYTKSRQWAQQIIQEMKDTGIEPSLTSFYYVIRTVYSNDEVTSDILLEIVDYLKGKELVGQEPADYEFFATAMAKCYTNQKDLDLAYKIDELLNTGRNTLLLGKGFKHGQYYTYFLRTLCTFDQIDKIMENYERITPHVYTPTFAAYEELLTAIELNEGYDYLPHLWSDLVLFDYTRRTDLIEQLLRIMGKKKQNAELQTIFLQISQYVLEKFEEEKLTRRLRPFELTGVMIGDLMQIAINGGDFDAARNFFKIYEDNKLNIEKFPSEDSLVSFSDACIEKNESDLALQCLQLMADFAYPKVDQVAASITKGLKLTNDQTNFIDDLL